MEHRIAHRFPTDLEAECRCSGRSWTARLRNISTNGCMILCPGPSLPESALLRLRLKDQIAIDGQVVWQNRGYAGIRFKVPLHQALLELLGFEEPKPEGSRPAEPIQPLPRPNRAPPSLHAQLVKRVWCDDPGDQIAITG